MEQFGSSKKDNLSRRTFLKAGGAAALSGFLAGDRAVAASQSEGLDKDPSKIEQQANKMIEEIIVKLDPIGRTLVEIHGGALLGNLKEAVTNDLKRRAGINKVASSSEIRKERGRIVRSESFKKDLHIRLKQLGLEKEYDPDCQIAVVYSDRAAAEAAGEPRLGLTYAIRSNDKVFGDERLLKNEY
jgi:hypothetical protein